MSDADHGEGARGRSLIAGEWAEAQGAPFQGVDPGSGREIGGLFYAASREDVDAACWSAWEAFFAEHDADARAEMLEVAARNIIDLGDELISVGARETGLGPARLTAERERATSTLRLFARVIREGAWMEATIETAEPARRPVAKPDLRSMLRPLGPVAVFGTCSFPLAYSVAGSDTASAMGAGCPVVAKGHPSHPWTSELLGRAVTEAVEQAGLHPGFYSMVHSGWDEEEAIGAALAGHPCVRAVGFTGTSAGGKALMKVAAERGDPIPVYAQMGSTNPVFVLGHAAEAHGEAIAKRIGESVCNANGQMCTCPGLIFAVRGIATESFGKALASQFNASKPETMLSHRVRDRYIERCESVSRVKGVEIRGGSPMGGHREKASGLTGEPVRASAVLMRTDDVTYQKHAHLREEIFGPAALLVVCDGVDALLACAAAVQGSLTGTIWASGSDTGTAQRLQRVLEQRAGRVIFNGVPTGIELCEAMVHGGAYPACSQAQFTSIGSRALRRWVRPVCYQNAPDLFLPGELRQSNPLGVRRVVDGEGSDGVVRRVA